MTLWNPEVCETCGSDLEYVGRGRWRCIEECAGQNINEEAKG